jgi:hypothetical protein
MRNKPNALAKKSSETSPFQQVQGKRKKKGNQIKRKHS